MNKDGTAVETPFLANVLRGVNMKNLTSNEIRTLWLSFFKEKKHAVLPGASLIPQNDKTLLWINSGVAALKQYFDGSKVTSERRIANVQKSIRTNDIEHVGKTNRHHTFFEMLGNFSIGDYFRKEAVTWGFEFLTSPKWLALPIEKLYFTYHPSDLETKNYWLSCGVLPTHIIANEDNFWEIGEGPCGPNTEIFFDLGESENSEAEASRLLSEDVDNDRFLEIWNIVFSQYNAKAGVKRSEYEELPSKNIDTGAGLERIASVLQQVESNFEIDVFVPIIQKISEISHKEYATNKVSLRVISDHLRSTVFALSDGARFSNEGRGYVLRRLLRRAIRYGRKLGITKEFMPLLVPSVVNAMKDFYPDLEVNMGRVIAQISAEEKRFNSTLMHGEELLRNALADNKEVTGEIAFKLYDTFGFPLEITIEIAEEEGASVDLDRFHVLLEEQREKARSARKNEASMNIQSKDLLNFAKESKFSSEVTTLKAKVIGLFKDGEAVTSSDSEVSAIFDITPFYSESGGQVSDTGRVEKDGLSAEVIAMSKAPHGQHLHHLNIDFGTLKIGDEVALIVNRDLRHKIVLNHSATHLLHRALNDVLGPEVSQAGSYVGPDYLRFDFNYGARITSSELQEIEALVNKYVNDNLVLNIEFTTVEEAKKRGAKAQFMEKYGDLVRVVSFGDVSVELCGGIHVTKTSEIGAFVIVSEGSVASGIRRITALSGIGAYEYLKEYQRSVMHLSEVFHVSDRKEVLTFASNLVSENKLLKEKAEVQKRRELDTIALGLQPLTHDAINYYYYIGKNLSREDLTIINDKIKSLDPAALIILIGTNSDSNALLISVNTKIKALVDANKLMRSLNSEFGGRGGGRSDFANGVINKLPSPAEIDAIIKRL